MTGQLELVAILTPAEGKLQALQDTLTSLVETVKGQELGIRKWELYVDEKTGEIVTIEIYENQEALVSHQASSHMAAAFKTVEAEGLLAKPFEVKILKRIGGFTR